MWSMAVFWHVVKIVHINYQLEFQVDATTAAPRKLHKEKSGNELAFW